MLSAVSTSIRPLPGERGAFCSAVPLDGMLAALSSGTATQSSPTGVELAARTAGGGAVAAVRETPTPAPLPRHPRPLTDPAPSPHLTHSQAP